MKIRTRTTIAALTIAAGAVLGLVAPTAATAATAAETPSVGTVIGTVGGVGDTTDGLNVCKRVLQPKPAGCWFMPGAAYCAPVWKTVCTRY